MYKLDKIDKALLKLLQENGRATISSLSNAVSLSMPAVSERVKRLEASGVIQKFTTLLNPSLVDKQLMALVQIGFDMQKHADRFVDFVETEKDIKECYRITANYEYTLKVQTNNTNTLAELLNRIKAQAGVNKTHSIVVLSSIIDRPSVIIN